MSLRNEQLTRKYERLLESVRNFEELKNNFIEALDTMDVIEQKAYELSLNKKIKFIREQKKVLWSLIDRYISTAFTEPQNIYKFEEGKKYDVNEIESKFIGFYGQKIL